jgi:hypothetical protein
MGARMSVKENHGGTSSAIPDADHDVAEVDPIQSEPIEHRRRIDLRAR